jgi:polyhydroxyalkanoate synthase
MAYADWAVHLFWSPGKWLELAQSAVRKEARLANYAVRMCTGQPSPPFIDPLPQDRRFRAPSWQSWPYSAIYQGFLLNQQWWQNATTGVRGVSAHHEQLVSFMARQLLDMFSPVNFVASNPEVQDAIKREGGMNFVRGARNLLEDLDREAHMAPPPDTENFVPGKQVALTPGKVIFRNSLIELIQYSPRTDTVQAEPMLIVPAWIMKYYILDLSRHNSLVRYLVDNGHTVFMISWHNPTAQDRDVGLDNYLSDGVLAAVKAVQSVVPGKKIDAVGYCLGGTLLSVAAAYLSVSADDPFNTVTLLAAQTDFSEAGELTLFIDESQIALLEDLMWRQGYLDTRQMAGAFQLLRSNDLIWSRMVQHYLLGQRMPMTDLAAWNADTTRMPYRMHSEYLRQMFCGNTLFSGKFKVRGKPVALSDIRAPIFALAAEGDHVAPWRSVYKVNLVADTEVTFALTSGGHNAGIVSEPGHAERRVRLSRRLPDDRYIDPDRWFDETAAFEGSWWPLWQHWLAQHTQAEETAPPEMGAPALGYIPLCPSPGTYVHER